MAQSSTYQVLPMDLPQLCFTSRRTLASSQERNGNALVRERFCEGHPQQGSRHQDVLRVDSPMSRLARTSCGRPRELLDVLGHSLALMSMVASMARWNFGVNVTFARSGLSRPPASTSTPSTRPKYAVEAMRTLTLIQGAETATLGSWFNRGRAEMVSDRNLRLLYAKQDSPAALEDEELSLSLPMMMATPSTLFFC